MPLFKTIAVNSQTIVKVWHISESLDLLSNIELTQHSLLRSNNLKSHKHKLGFLSVRFLLQEFGYRDEDVFYDSFGKPHLKDGKYISISHSFEYSAVAVSSHLVGLDVEKIRNKMVQIAPKFIGFESCFLNQNHKDYVVQLTQIWCIKESLYKLYSKSGISFKNQLLVLPIEMEKNQTMAWILDRHKRQRFKANCFEFDGYICTITTPSL